MNSVQLLREQFKGAHDTLEATMADATPEVSDFSETNKALPVGAAYAHAILCEDVLLAMMLSHKEPVLKDSASIGLSEAMPSMDKWDEHEAWAHRVKVDLAKFKSYAKDVYEQTDAYLATIKDEDLDREVETSFGKHTLAFILTNFFVLHIANLTGEISAAKGFQGKKGYPF